MEKQGIRQLHKHISQWCSWRKDVSINWTPYCCRPTESRFDGSSRKRDANRLVAMWWFLCVLILAFNDNLLRWIFGVWLKLPWRYTPAGSQKKTLWPWKLRVNPEVTSLSSKSCFVAHDPHWSRQRLKTVPVMKSTSRQLLKCSSARREKTRWWGKNKGRAKIDTEHKSRQKWKKLVVTGRPLHLCRNLFFLRVKDTGKVAACSPATCWPLKAVYHISAFQEVQTCCERPQSAGTSSTNALKLTSHVNLRLLFYMCC